VVAAFCLESDGGGDGGGEVTIGGEPARAGGDGGEDEKPADGDDGAGARPPADHLALGGGKHVLEVGEFLVFLLQVARLDGVAFRLGA